MLWRLWEMAAALKVNHRADANLHDSNIRPLQRGLFPYNS